MFRLQEDVRYGRKGSIGRAVVSMNQNGHAKKIKFIYQIDRRHEWHFYYENGTVLSGTAQADLEHWFIIHKEMAA